MLKSNKKTSSIKFASIAFIVFCASTSAIAKPITPEDRNFPLGQISRFEQTAASLLSQAGNTLRTLAPTLTKIALSVPRRSSTSLNAFDVGAGRITGTASTSLGKLPTRQPATGLFGSVAISFRSLPAAATLNQITSNDKGMEIECLSAGCSSAKAKLSSAIAKLQTASENEKIRSVNALVNSIVAYSRDADTYGRTDYWATPSETLNRGKGDCEDFAILKMAALQQLGIPASNMSVVIVSDDRRNLFHAVLTVRTSVGSLILDNVRPEILLDRSVSHYTPLYSVSAGKGYIHGQRAADGRTAMTKIRFDNIAPGEGPY